MKTDKIQFIISITLSVVFSSAIVFYFVSAQTTETSLREEGLIVGGLPAGISSPPTGGAVIKGTLDLNWSGLEGDSGLALVVRGQKVDPTDPDCTEGYCGKVGIGTQDPQYLLHVAGKIRSLGLGLPSVSGGSVNIRNSWDSIRLMLVNGAHSVQDCLAAPGGHVARYADSPNVVCQFNASSCPAGWTKYNNWSTTRPKTCSENGACPCTTSSHLWDNKDREFCNYGGLIQLGPTTCLRLSQCFADVTEVGCY